MLDLAAVLLAKPAGKLANKLLKPVIDKLSGSLNDKAQLVIHQIFNSYSSYLDNSYERYSYFTSIVFKNEQKKLIDYYLPLTLLTQPTNFETKILNFPSELLENYGKLLIVDTAGMGKTTLLKFMFISCVESAEAIPIYIELRKLTKKISILEYITEQLSDLQGNNKEGLLFQLLESGKFIIFLDGYDEIPEDIRTHVTSELQKFIEKTPKNKFIMSSREENGLVAFSQFQRFVIKPLQKQEAYKLLEMYGDTALSEVLIKKLELPENQNIHEFLTNPLLTSLLYKSFEFKQAIPLKRHIFYHQVYEALFETHDLVKDTGEYQRKKRCGLDIDKFEHMLRALGVLTYRKDKIEFTKAELADFVEQAKSLLGEKKVVTSEVIHDLTHAVPLMVIDGNYIRWNHKSIQEYFTAQYICKNTLGKQREILLKYSSVNEFKKHMNLILLCADIDTSSFKQSIGKMLAEKLLEEYKSLYKRGFKQIPDQQLEIRKQYIVGKLTFFIRVEFPLEEHDRHDRHEQINMLIKPIQDEMEKQANVSVPSGSHIMLSNPGIGRLTTYVSELIDNLIQRTSLPFIKKPHIESFTMDPSQDHIDKNIKVLIIDGKTKNPVNDIKNFSLINQLIRQNQNWIFDAKEAKDYLKELEDETQSQEHLLKW